MTTTEAQVLAQRLERVWGDLGPFVQVDHKTFMLSTFPSIILEIQVIHSGLFFKMHRETRKHEECFQLRAWSSGTMHIGNRPACDPHIDLFRRRVWLSGANIEASGHEKLEWIEGFTQEELDAWNLKF